MKRLTFILYVFLFIPLHMMGQSIPKTIWGCQFGCERNIVEENIQKQGFSYEVTMGNIRIGKSYFCGLPFEYAYFNFYLGQLYSCEFHINLKTDADVQEYVDTFQKKYGKPLRIKKYDIRIYGDNENSVIFQGYNKRFMIVLFNDKLLNKSLSGE